MQNNISYKSLIRLSSCRMKRSKSKGAVFGSIFGVLYFWIFEIGAYIVCNVREIDVPAVVPIIICFSSIIPDFLLKLIFVRDNTVMDAFLKTRPVTQEMWDRFLTISQFWKIGNLLMPLIVLPLCVLFMPAILGIFVWIAMYLLSVFGGFIVMLIKHKGAYQPENAVKVGKVRTVNSARGRNIFGIQTRSLLRSKRLKTLVITMCALFYLQCILQSLSSSSNAVLFNVVISFAICVMPYLLLQYGFGIESNFFGAIWTKPFAIRRLLYDKYWFCVILCAIGSVLCIPFCFFSDLQIMTIVSFFLFSAGFGSLCLLFDPYKCEPFEMYSNAFFNYQGASTANKASIWIGALVIMGIVGGATYFLPNWYQIVLSALGVIGFCVRKPYFEWVENKFLKDRYRYMEKYFE